MIERPGILRGGVALLVLTVVVLAGSAAAAADESHPLEPADTSSPRATLQSFVEAANEIYALLTAADPGKHSQGRFVTLRDSLHYCLDLRQEPEFLREQFADEVVVCLKEVLDRIELPPFEEIPGDAAAPDAPTRWRIPHTAIAIVRMSEGERQGEYLFSARTVNRAPHYYALVKHLPYRASGPARSEGLYEWFLSAPGSKMVAAVVDVLPDWTRHRLGRMAIWQWVGLVLIFVLGLGFVFFFSRLAKRLAGAPDVGVVRRGLRLLSPLSAIAFGLWARAFIAEGMAVSGMVLAVSMLLLNLVFLCGLVGLLIGIFQWVAEVIIASPRVLPQGLDAQFTRLVVRLLSLIAVVVVFLEGGRLLGISLTTLLAGAGVGGLVLALSAQDVLKNLFGSMTIMLDRPFRVGERIVAKGYDGFVEEIGMRSTKIRLLTGHVAWIPNDTMARTDIANIDRRPPIRQVTDLPLPLDTPPEKVEQALAIVTGALEDHEGMDPKYPPRVHATVHRDSMIVRFFYWYHPPDYWKFVSFNEQVLLRIDRELAAIGLHLTPPTAIAILNESSGQSPESKGAPDIEAS